MQRTVLKRSLGETVKARAAEKGIPISVLEKRSGYSPGMVSRWCTAGNEDYNALSKLVAMADLLDLSLDELVGRQTGNSRVESPGGPVAQLLSETNSGLLTWLPWNTTDTFPVDASVPPCDTGRLCAGGYWTERRELKLVLVCYCDDVQDRDEKMELALYCTPEHQFPLFSVLPNSASELPELYAQILLRTAFFSAGGADAAFPEKDEKVKTIPFRVQGR